MFKKMLQVSSVLGRGPVREEEPSAAPLAPSSPCFSDRDRMEPAPKPVTTKLPSFDDIYRKSPCKTATTTAEYTILKVADMVNSNELHGLSPAARHSALIMALKAAGVAVEDMLQDAVYLLAALLVLARAIVVGQDRGAWLLMAGGLLAVTASLLWQTQITTHTRFGTLLVATRRPYAEAARAGE